MRLEIEIDYEPNADEAAQIRDARTNHERRRIVQGWVGLTGCVVQGVGVIKREGPS